RHTRWPRDWSSDVCSSDLPARTSMFALIAYVEVLAGEHYCNGIPLSSFVGSEVVYGDPLSNDSLFALAAANADSALNALSAADADSRGADSLRVKWLAQVVKGRALLDRA